MKKSLLLALAAIALCANAREKAFCGSDATYRLTGAEQADAAAVKALQVLNPTADGAIEVVVGERGDDVVAPWNDKIPTKSEGYYLSVAPGKVVIAGADEAGTFYGVQTFLSMAGQCCVPQVAIADSPAIARRGVIEGFYGNPWSHADRLSQFDFYGRHKMNTYVYGPKDDPYHHARWYEPYPDDKAAEMKALTTAAAANKVKFIWAMHPSNSIETKADRQKALAKFRQMYSLGVRNFAIFFDDISAKSVDAQIDYLNFLDREFVKKHPDVGNLVMCPTVYNRSWASGDYLHRIGTELNDDIEIMWTGNTVCDMINVEDCQWFTGQTTRLPYIWLNYPVNDYGQHNLLMGPMYGNDKEIAPMVSAFCSNPMQYAEASKMALAQIADFAWNPEGYDQNRSWLAALAELQPEHTEAFRLFCENNEDVGLSVHALRFLGETPDFPSLQTPDDYQQWFEARRDAANELLAAADSGDPLLTEVREWIVALQLQAAMGLETVAMQRALDNDNPRTFIAAYSRYAALDAEAGEIVSRGFEGSIQAVHVQTGTLHVKPWLKQTTRSLIDRFKQAGYTAPEGLFPTQVLENGSYYIKHNGRWLGNPQAGGKGGAPVFQADIDDINPNRQEWLIVLDPVTERYSIRNSKDERYINEIFNFGVNPYSRDWNTYIIKKNADCLFSIQNAGNGGQNFWGVDGDAIKAQPVNENHYIFEIIPTHE